MKQLYPLPYHVLKASVLIILLSLLPITVDAKKITRTMSFYNLDYSTAELTDGTKWRLENMSGSAELYYYEDYTYGLMINNSGVGSTFTVRSEEELPKDVKMTVTVGASYYVESYPDNFSVTISCENDVQNVTTTNYNTFQGSARNLNLEDYTFDLHRNSAGSVDFTIENTGITPYTFIYKIEFEYEVLEPVLNALGEVTFDGNGEGLGKDIEFVTDKNIPVNGYIANNILYSLGKDDGYLLEDGVKTVALNTVNKDLVNNWISDEPGTPGFFSYYKGCMAFVVPAGNGTITLDARTAGSGTLNVRVAGMPVKTFENLTEFQEVEIPYYSAVQSYVYIYNNYTESSSSRAPGRKMTTTVSVRKVRVRVAATGPSTDLPKKVLMKNHISVTGNHIIVDDASFTQIATDVFTDVQKQYPRLTYIDLSGTSITGYEAERRYDQPWNWYAHIRTFYYLPYGNDIYGDNIVVGEACKSFLLYTESPFEVAHDFVAINAKFTTDFDVTETPVVLPFALDQETCAKIGTFYEFKGIKDGKVQMQAVAAVEADKPYILKFNDGVKNINAQMVEVLAAKEAAASRRAAGDPEFVGVFAPTKLTSDAYVFDAGQFKLVKAETEVKAFQAYIAAPGATAETLDIAYDNSTGIRELKNSSIEGLNIYYDLQGRRVARPVKGVYILNGKKVVIK